LEGFTARGYFSKLKVGDLFFKNLVNAVKGGNNSLMQNLIVEDIKNDDKWIDQIEELVFSIEQVVKNPKKSIIDEAVIVQIEKAKRISSQSIRHLSSHSNYIRSIDDDGTVHPSKIMTTIMDEDLLIYENRFVYTLITRLLTFLEQKRESIAQNFGKTQIVDLNFKSDFNYSDTVVDYDLKIKIKKPIKEKSTQETTNIIERINTLKKRVYLLTGSDFFKKLSKTNPLTPPISKTNIIKMNYNYNNCYKLWLFISSYVKTGYSVKISETNLPSEQDYYDDLTYLVVMSLKTLYENKMLKASQDDDYDEPPVKDLNIEQEINYIPDFKLQSDNANIGDYINIYYYEKIKEILEHDEKQTDNTIKVNKDIAYSFLSFYKQLSKINNTLFDDLLTFDYDKESYKELSKAQTKQQDLKYTKEIYRRAHLLTELKKIDYQTTLRKETYMLTKIKQLEKEVQELKAEKQDSNIKSVAKQDKNRLQIIEEIIKNDDEISKTVLNETDSDKK